MGLWQCISGELDMQYLRVMICCDRTPGFESINIGNGTGTSVVKDRTVRIADGVFDEPFLVLPVPKRREPFQAGWAVFFTAFSLDEVIAYIGSLFMLRSRPMSYDHSPTHKSQ